MKTITYHDRKYLRKNNLVMLVNEEEVHFINGIAAVNAIVIDRNSEEKTICSGIINEEYQEVFDDEDQYGNYLIRRNLMFLEYNTNILRCGENDFIVSVCRGNDDFSYTVNKHIRIKDMKATLVNEDIGYYFKKNNENILIIDGMFNRHEKKLYNIAKGEFLKEAYDEIFIIEDNPNCFTVKKRVNSLTEESSKNEDLYLSDDLYFQIDQDGNIISKVFSQRKLDYLDYGDLDINQYPTYRKQELVEKNKKLKDAVYSLKRSKQENK